MINIFYNSKDKINGRFDGPTKVANNIILGLEKLQIPFSSNVEIFDCNFMVHYNPVKYASIKNKKNTIIGPTVWIFNDNYLQTSDDFKYIISPSAWVTNKFVAKTVIKKEKVVDWACGIDTDRFNDSGKNVSFDCLVYFKRRDEKELGAIVNILSRFNQTFEIMRYGSYDEGSFISAMQKCRYAVVIDGTESQGIALQEIMSSNVPIICWDVSMYTDMGENYLVPASSIPYWDERCGEQVFSASEFEKRLPYFISKLDTYNPRQYILENLSLEIKTNDILNFFKK